MKLTKMMTILLCMSLLLTLFAGCGGSGNSTDTGSNADAGADVVENDGAQTGNEDQAAANGVDGADGFTVGLIQLMEHPSLDTIRTSFMAEMDALGYGAVHIEYANGQNDMSLINTIAQNFVGQEVDVIVAIATPAAIGAASATDETPIIFSAVTDPIIADLLVDLNAPDRNITGVSDAIPAADIFNLALQLTPDIETIGFVYNLGEPNSVSVINDAKAYCDANGIAYLESTVTDSSEVQQAAQSLVGSVDAFFTPIDNTVASAMPIYAQVAIDAGLPVYVGADSMVEDGGLATFGINYTLLGQETARMVVQVLEGAAIADLPVVIMDDFRAIANQTTADAIGVALDVIPELEIVR